MSEPNLDMMSSETPDDINTQNDNNENLKTSGFLLKSGDIYYTIQMDTLVQLSITSLNSNVFKLYAFDELPTESILMSLVDPVLYYWDEDTTSVHSYVCNQLATPFPQTLYSINYSMVDKSILGIEGARVIASDDCTFAISFNDGETWKMYISGEWVTLTQDDTGMTASTLNTIPTQHWNSIATTGMYKLRVTIPTADSYFTSFIMDYLNPD